MLLNSFGDAEQEINFDYVSKYGLSKNLLSEPFTVHHKHTLKWIIKLHNIFHKKYPFVIHFNH